MIKGLISISSDDLKKSDKRALSTMYLYWLENGKPGIFDLPLFIDDNGKGVMSVEAFKRVFFAFCQKVGTAYSCEIASGSDGDDASYNVVRLEKIDTIGDNVTLTSPLFESYFEEPKKADVKRESSKKTAEKSAEKKAKKEAESKKEADKLADDFAKSHAKKITDLVMGKYGLKLSAEKLSSLEADLIAILKM